MAMIRMYVKKKLQLNKLNLPQREMWALGNFAIDIIKERTAKAVNSDDAKTALKSKSWANIKKSRGLRPIRDLRGTGWMYPEKPKGERRKRKYKLKFVGHLIDLIRVSRVSENKLVIGEPSQRAARKKWRGNKVMLLFSPKDCEKIAKNAGRILNTLIHK